ncbi:hypothetical protein NX059_010896 [Plenodomus lindquistii]|nr:hypothetical protein NX059_010896 [Plenodomus lindquistii]
MRTRSSREISIDGSTQRPGKKDGPAEAAKVARADKRAPFNVDCSEQEMEDFNKRLDFQPVIAALAIRPKIPTAHAPASAPASKSSDTKVGVAKDDAQGKSQNEDEIVSELVGLVRNAGLASHGYWDIRSFLLNNSATCHAATTDQMTLWVRKIMSQVKAEDTVAKFINKDTERVLPGWPRDIVPTLTKLVRNAELPALDSNCVGAYIREICKGADKASLEKWTASVMQNLQQGVAKGTPVKDGSNRAFAIDLTGDEDVDRVAELHASSKKRKFVDLTQDEDDYDEDDHYTSSRHGKQPSSLKNRRSFLEYPDIWSDCSDSERYSPTPDRNARKPRNPAVGRGLGHERVKAESSNGEKKPSRKQRKEYWSEKHRSHIGGGKVMFTYLQAKAYLENPPKNNIKYDMKTGEHFTVPITRSYHLGAMGRYA